jgi:IS5 family transposase
VGRTPYSGLLLFKMLLIGIWYGGLSDEMVEEKANADLYVMKFLGLSLEDNVPDHSTLSRFRTHMTALNAWDTLLNDINHQIDEYGLLVKSGVSVDASVTVSQRKPSRKTTYEVHHERDEVSDEPEAKKFMQQVEVVESGADTEARFTKKGGKTLFGYKQHTAVDRQGLVLSVVSSASNQHDSLALESVIRKAVLTGRSVIYTDKAYVSQKHHELLKCRICSGYLHFLRKIMVKYFIRSSIL